MVRVASPYGSYQGNEEEATFRRYSNRGLEYPISHDRDYSSAPSQRVYPGSRSHHPSPHEPRTTGRSPESDSSSRPRSRIQIACGRCRKRKIRCSGDAGNGEPCTNCKNSGNEHCQFLRVTAEEVLLKTEGCTAYKYNDASGGSASRVNCRMPSGPQYGPQNTPLPLDGYHQYRQVSAPNYQQFAVKPYFPIAPFGDFNGDELGYNIQGQLIGNEDLGVAPNYITSTSTRGWPATPQLPKTPLYIEQSDTTFSHDQIPMPLHHGVSFPSRPNSGHRNMSLDGMSASLPPPVGANGERLLPFPTGNPGRQAHIGGPYRYSDGLPSAPSLQSQSFDTNCNYIRNIKHNINATSENASLSSNSYITNSSTSPESLSSSQMAYGSQPSASMSQQSSEIYTPSSQDLCPSDSEPSYGHNPSIGSKQPSIGSQGSNAEGSLPSVSDHPGRLTNGQEYRYVPTMGNYNQGYPMPPILHHPVPLSRTSLSVGADHD
ncbi:hemagglutinin protein [Drepanopeziza brunnea f. sp. 'multigermtubi' MB_m1]|uniref:Hemagglutinin protein n=2 Tax=Drepanopeziza brunnea f. sp. 'multigermtubi' TaxID=698441 RepID=K1WRF1_MARBU|nr:hemagglutinin protein [Drepanopeziza brunnea f. sp. 'multigermtubi' MB_m1]EKD20215.1 hemagglutinin protein [Drepanopeziza brunnea f. sp. 'multigermtubi' MB_m1]